MSSVKKRAARKSSSSDQPFEVSEALFKRLEQIGKPCHVSAGTFLFSLGQPTTGVYLVLSGRIALSAGDDPVRITRIAERASVLGLPATVRDQPYTLTAEAVTDTELCHIAPADLRLFLQENPNECFEVLQIVAEELSAIRRVAVYRA